MTRIDRAFAALPIIDTFDGLRVRWLGPLVDQGHDAWMGELAEAAWGYLELCGWQAAYGEGGPMLGPDGAVRPTWEGAFGQAARLLAEEGGRAGPEGDPERWAAWLAFELSDPHRWIRGKAEGGG